MATGFWKHQCRDPLASCTSPPFPQEALPALGSLSLEAQGPPLLPAPSTKTSLSGSGGEPHPETQHTA